MAAGNLPAGDQVSRLAGLPGFEADHHGPNIDAAEADLHRQIGDIGRTGNPWQRQQGTINVITQTRRFCVWPLGLLLHHPNIGTAVIEQCLGVVDHAAINAGHGQGHANQQTQADTGQDEL